MSMKAMAIGFALALGVAGAASAQSAASETGTIRSVDQTAGTLTIRTDQGRDFTFKIQGDARIMERGIAVELRELEPGDRVTVTATGEGDPRVAQRIEVISETAGTGTGGAEVGVGAGAGARVGDTGAGAAGAGRVGVDESGVRGGGDVDVSAGRAGEPDAERRMAAADRDDTDREGERFAGGRLPETASAVPLIGAMGGGLLLASLGLRALRARSRS